MGRKTGRSRSVTVSASLAFQSDLSDVFLANVRGIPAAPLHPPNAQNASGGSLGSALGVAISSLDGGVWQETEVIPPSSGGFIAQYRYKYKGFLSLTGQFLGAATGTYAAFENTYVYDAWQFWDLRLGPVPEITGKTGTWGAQIVDGSYAVSCSISLVEWYDAFSIAGQSGILAEYPSTWAATIRFTGRVCGYNGAWHSWTGISGTVTLAGTMPDPATPYSNTAAGYAASLTISGNVRARDAVNGVPAGSISFLPGDFRVSGPGLNFAAGGSGTTPDGLVTFSGGPLGCTLSAHDLDLNTSLPNYLTCSGGAVVEPDWTLEWSVDARRYRDSSPIAPALVHRGDKSGAATVLGGGSAPTYSYSPGAWSTVSVFHGSFGTPQVTQQTTGHHLFDGYNHYLGVDDTWADANAGLLNGHNFEGYAKWLPVWAGSEFQFGTLKVDGSHAFGLFASPGSWSWTGGGSPSLDLGALKLSNLTTFNGTAQWANRLKYFVYRYVELVVQSDQPNATFDLRLLSNTVVYTWHLTLGGANSWQTLTLDLGLPDETSVPNANGFPLHPRFFGSAGARIQLHPTATGNFWFQSLTGIHRDGGGHTALRLIGPAMCDQPGDPFHSNSPANDDAALEAFDSPIDDAAASSIIALPGGSLYARLVANGLLGIDLSGDASSFPAGASLTTVWALLRSQYDNDQIPFGFGTPNDTGIHLAFTGSTRTDETLHRCGYSLSSPWFAQDSFPLDTAVPLLGRPRGWCHGYYGCGDPWGSGAYGATILFHADAVFGGEICGTYAATGRGDGPHVNLIDSTTGAAQQTATIDLDGFYRLPGRYGVLNTYSNAPTPPPLGTGTSAARKQFTNTGGVYAYTAQGEQLNYYSLQGDSLLWADSSGRLLVSNAGRPRRGIILDRYASWYDILPGATPFRPVDLAETSNGWVWRATRQGTSIIVESTLDAGVSWSGPAVASDAAGAGAPHGAAPTLLVTPWDDLFVWYHDNLGAARCYVSSDLGSSWSLYTTVANLRFPRACWTPGETLLVGWDGAALRLYRDGATFGAAPSSVTTFGGVAQLAALRADRRQVPHLIYTDGAHLQHRYQQSDGSWSAPSLLASGTLPGLALGVERGAYAGWTTLETLRLTDETYAADHGAAGVPAPAPGAAPLGLWFDGREQLWAVYQPASGGALVTRISPDKAASWETPS